MRATLAAFAPYARPGLPIVLCAKGIERGSLKLMTEVLAETIPGATPAVLSGPSFAAEVARGVNDVSKVVRLFEIVSEERLADMQPAKAPVSTDEDKSFSGDGAAK